MNPQTPLDAGAASAEQRAEINYAYFLKSAHELKRERPGYFALLGTTPERYAQSAEIEYAAYLEQGRMLEREHPEELAALGETPEEYALAMIDRGGSIEEAVARGWMSAAMGHLFAGCATREDLVELGYAPDKIQAILELQERACAS